MSFRESYGMGHPRLRRKKPHEAGKTTVAKFQIERERTIRREWRFWLLVALLNLGAAVGVGFSTGTTQVIWSFFLGAFVTTAVFGWEMGGNPRNLTWLWGSAGEVKTEELLWSLDDSWECIHDIPCRKGNWDHVLVGSPGVFLLDSKSYSSASEAKDDELRSGRLRCRGSDIRGAAISLKEALEPKVGKQYVNAAVVIWGEFRQKLHEENRVTYLRSNELLGWLSEQPGRLSERERKTVAQAVRDLKEVSETQEVPERT